MVYTWDRLVRSGVVKSPQLKVSAQRMHFQHFYRYIICITVHFFLFYRCDVSCTRQLKSNIY